MIEETTLESSYGRLASEYYDVELHPTCSAFDQLSSSLLKEWLSSRKTASLTVCDVGAGNSQVARILDERLAELSALWLVDESREMLDCSRRFQSANVHRRIARADQLHLFGIKFDLIVASLGDPYNTDAFWHSVKSSLSDDGRCLFTTPSFEWASTFRQADSDELMGRALFVLSNGEKHYVPSYIYPTETQNQMLTRNGLEIIEKRECAAANLAQIPPKLAQVPPGSSIVTLYVGGHRA